MKKNLCCVLLAVSSTLAQAEGLYAGIATGPSKKALLQQDVGGQTVSSESGSHLPEKLFVGYDFTSYVGVEGGYTYYGSFSQHLPGDASVNVNVKPDRVYLALTGTWHVDQDWSLFGKAGGAQGRFDGTVSNASQSQTVAHHGNSLYASVGAAYAINRDWSVQLELERAAQVRYQNFGWGMSGVSLGLRYSF